MKKRLTFLIILFTYLFVFFKPFSSNAQSNKNQVKGFELGFDALPYLNQIGDGIPGLRKDWEFFFKSKMEKGGFRVKFGHHLRPIHKRLLFKEVIVSNDCIEGSMLKNNRKPNDFYFINLGYERKLMVKKFEIIAGADLNLNRYHSVTIVNKFDCLIVENGIQYGIDTQWKIIKNSNYSGVGITPFLGVKIPILKHLRLTLETGLQFNWLTGDYTYLKADLDEGYHPAKDFEINWGSLTTDVGLSYAF